MTDASWGGTKHLHQSADGFAMTPSRGQFDTRHDDETAPDEDGPPGGLRAALSFHRIESLLALWLVVGGIVVPMVFGLGGLLFGPGTEAVPDVATSAFWAAVLLALPLLALVLLVHAAVDAVRVLAADGEVASAGRAILRSLQTASAVAFVWGVQILFQETSPDAEFDPAALLSAFMLVVGLVGMTATVGTDSLLRTLRGTW